MCIRDRYTTLQYELMKLLSSVTNQGASAESMKNATAASAVTPTSVRAAATILTMLPIVCQMCIRDRGTSNYNIVMYADNPGIVNGGSFWRCV